MAESTSIFDRLRWDVCGHRKKRFSKILITSVMARFPRGGGPELEFTRRPKGEPMMTSTNLRNSREEQMQRRLIAENASGVNAGKTVQPQTRTNIWLMLIGQCFLKKLRGWRSRVSEVNGPATRDNRIGSACGFEKSDLATNVGRPDPRIRNLVRVWTDSISMAATADPICSTSNAIRPEQLV